MFYKLPAQAIQLDFRFHEIRERFGEGDPVAPLKRACYKTPDRLLYFPPFSLGLEVFPSIFSTTTGR